MDARAVKALVVTGLLAGLLAGIFAGLTGLLLAEPRIEAAIAVEALGEHGDGGSSKDAAAGFEVGREAQKLGLVLAAGLYDLAVGGLAALVVLGLRGRTAHRSDRALAVSVVAALFVAAVAIPFVKYPASPPGVGDAATIGERTELYLVLVGGSLAALLAAWRVSRFVTARARRARALAFCGTFAVLTALLMLSLPGVNEVPGEYPPDVLRDFRLASILIQVTLWTGLAIGFAALLERRSRSGSPP